MSDITVITVHLGEFATGDTAWFRATTGGEGRPTAFHGFRSVAGMLKSAKWWWEVASPPRGPRPVRFCWGCSDHEPPFAEGWLRESGYYYLPLTVHHVDGFPGRGADDH